jgi:hypothetical protein
LDAGSYYFSATRFAPPRDRLRVSSPELKTILKRDSSPTYLIIDKPRFMGCFGGAEGIRTLDLLDAIEARFQLRHGPTGNDEFL